MLYVREKEGEKKFLILGKRTFSVHFSCHYWHFSYFRQFVTIFAHVNKVECSAADPEQNKNPATATATAPAPVFVKIFHGYS